MKKQFLAVIAFTFIVFSCSSDDDSGDSSLQTNHFPIAAGNAWEYDVVGQLPGTDNLYVGNDIVLGGLTYKQMMTTAEPFGFYSSLLRNNGLREDGSKTLFTGNLNVNLGFDLPIDLSVIDFVILKTNATVNEVLGTFSGTFTEDLEGTPITITYTLTATALESLPTFTTPVPQSETYTDVKKVKMSLMLSVTTTQTIPGTTISVQIPILASQEVLDATQYYAKNIGMVY
ncbi:MAG: hypothetical protein WD512_07165, partial [Candidatus Paceibacterota bacterium]